MKTVMIPPFPSGLSRAADPAREMRQGDEPHAACKEGVRLSSQWRLFEDDGGIRREIPVYSTPVTRGGPHSFAMIRYSGDEPVTLTAQCSEMIKSAEILPSSYGIKPVISDDGISFGIGSAGHVTVLINGRTDFPLTVSVLPVREKTDAGSVKGLYFGPGLHTMDYFDFEDGDTLYVDDGAVVTALPPPEDERPLNPKDWAGQKIYRGCVLASGKKNVRIEGGGILDFSLLDWHARSPVAFDRCSDVSVRDTALVNAPAWNLNISGCDGADAEFVRIFGYRENSDGIDIVSSQDVRISGCFIRTGDDAVCVKAMAPPPRVGGKNILCEKMVIWNDKVRCMGIAAESRNDISSVTFRDSDVIRSYADWTTELGSLVVYICDKAEVSDILFDDIRIEHEVHLATNILITKDFWSKDDEAGRIHNVVFRNITVTPKIGSRIAGYDALHTVSGVAYENFSVGGRRAASVGDAGIEILPFAENITVT